MRKHGSRFLALTVLAAALATACSSGSGNGEGSVVLQNAQAGPAAVTGTTVQEQSLAASRAFWAKSPAVVVTTPDAVEDALAEGEKLGVPVIVPGSDRSELVAEITRLGATHVLALAGAERDGATLGSATVVTEAGDLPRIEEAKADRKTAVLAKDEKSMDPFTRAAVEITGASVVLVPSGDPRTDPAVVEELADLEPTRVVAAGDTFGSPEAAAGLVATAATGTEGPGGGQLVLPGKRYVALYGHPGSPQLGVLGEQDLDGAVTRAKEFAARYDKLSEEPVIPTFEIITTVATGGPGPDGNYSNEVDPAVFEPWVKRAQEEGVYVLLDLQPGTTDFLTQARQYESLLKYPNVGLAIDPEWRLQPGQRHLTQIGQVDSAEINETTAWLAQVTRENKLPQKIVVLHQFQNRMITHRDRLDTSHPELALVIHADGHGTHGNKLQTWRTLREDAPEGVHWAWKNFIDEDTPMMTPRQTMTQVDPAPVLISYQ